MDPQRRSDEIAPKPDAVPETASADRLIAPLAAGFPVMARDAFRDKAEREARRRAEQTLRRHVGAGVAAPHGPPLATPAPSIQPSPTQSPLRLPPTPTRLIRAARSSRPSSAGGASAAIIAWPGRERTVARAMASTDAPLDERPPTEVEAPKVDAPKAEPSPPASAPFSAAEFWGNKKRPSGGGGGGGGSSGGGAGGVRRERAFNQDDIAGAVIVLLILLLSGWMLVNLGGKSPGVDPRLQPQLAQTSPVPSPPAIKPDPFPPGPIDLTPKSPMPHAEPSKAAPPVSATPMASAQAAPNPPTPLARPLGASCAPGRMIHAYFCTSRSDLSPTVRSALESEVADWRACVADQELAVKGYADTRGSTETNAALSADRARVFAELLRTQGLKVVEVQGLGELEGMEDGQNCANQRRVDVGLKSEIETATPSRACRAPKEAAPLACRSLPAPQSVGEASPAR